MRLRNIAATGGAALVLLPWLVAMAGVAFGAFAWSRPPRATIPVPGSAEESLGQIKTLRLSLSTAQAENQVLRQELDRLLAAGRSGKHPGAFAEPGSGMDGKSASDVPDEAQRLLAKNLQDLLALAANGDQAAKAEAARAIFDLLRAGPGALASLRDVYVNSADAKSKQMLLGSMIFSGSPQAKDFVLDQVQSEKDPEVRQMLMGQAARYATPDLAATLSPTFIQSVDSPADDPQTRAAAARGLRFAPGGDAGSALRRAAADPSEDVRLAAIDTLASRPGSLGVVTEILASDPSPRVREFAQCRILIAKELP